MAAAIDGLYELKLFSYCGTQLGLNVIHYRCTAVAGTVPTMAKCAEDMEAHWATVMKAAMSSEAEWLGVTFRELTPVLSATFPSTLLAGAGGAGASVLPRQVCGILTKRTPLAGRSNRGRMYVPFPAETDSDAAGTANAGYVTRLSAVGVVLISTVTIPLAGSTTFEPVVFRRNAPAASQRLSAYRANAIFATQRRRGSYGRTNARNVA